MRLEITPVYERDGEKKLFSVRKRIYLPDESIFAEWLLDWSTGEWICTVEMAWAVGITTEMRERLDWKKESDERPSEQ